MVTHSLASLSSVDPATLDPPYDFPDYHSTAKRAPRQLLLRLPPELAPPAGPVFGESVVGPNDHDLTKATAGEPIGERIIVSGRLLDRAGRPIRRQLVEVWQANAAGRYTHDVDRHEAPLDPHFTGYGRCLTGDDGSYRFISVRPGEYPWRNHPNAWRPAHIHFSVFGTAFTDRLVTQMYFPGDPLFDYDPIFHAVSAASRDRMICQFDLDSAKPEWALAYRFDITVGGQLSTPLST